MSDPFEERLDAALASEDSSPEPQVVEEEFAPPVHRDILSLLQIGYLQKEVDLYGHTFVLKTLNMEQELAVDQLLAEKFASGLNEKAYRTAMLAAVIDTYNGFPLAASLGPNDNALPRAFSKVKQWYRPVIYALFNEYLELEERQRQALAELEKKD